MSDRPQEARSAATPCAILHAAFEHAWFQRNTSGDGRVGPNAREAKAALDELLAVLYQIAHSYPWIPYEDDETIPGPFYIQDTFEKIPTNRRLARAALAVEEDAPDG